MILLHDIYQLNEFIYDFWQPYQGKVMDDNYMVLERHDFYLEATLESHQYNEI